MPLLVMAALLALVPAAARASVEHPVLYEGGEQKRNGVPVMIIGWGAIRLLNRYLDIECATDELGYGVNETEPGGSADRAYGEVQQWSAESNANWANFHEPSEGCTASGPLLGGFGPVVVAAEPPEELGTELATVNQQERLAIRRPPVRRELGLPWRQEAQGTETLDGPMWYLKTGIAETNRTEIEAEEAKAGTPTERRTGCYPSPPDTEIVRRPGFETERETELALRPAPQGCIHLTVWVPGLALAIPIQGSLEPQAVDGPPKSPLVASRAELVGGSPTEARSLERNERHLESAAFGPWYVQTVVPIHGFPFLSAVAAESLGLR
jgi:hypothetical protein